ncbi:MAG: LuxR C-terminal-related transcriptional regulator [Arachnia sp.]
MLEPYGDRIRVMELDSRMPVSRDVEVTLYDTFGKAQVDGEDIDVMLSNSHAGKVVIYTWNMHPVLIDQALSKGCRGYLDKGVSGEDLVYALERINAGDVVVSPVRSSNVEATLDSEVGQDRKSSHDAYVFATDEEANGDKEAAFGGGEWPGRAAKLSAREAEVLALITQGYTNNDIAMRSYLSINSVKSYIRSAYRKIQVERRSQAVRWGMENGMLPDTSRTIIH